MRATTDIFNCKEDPLDSVFASNLYGDIELQVEMMGELGFVTVTKKQAAQFAQQILEMCGEGNDES